MAQPPLTFLEQKWAGGWSGNNRLIEAATQTNQRLVVPRLDKDSHRSISQYGRVTLMSIGRWLYENCDVIRGAIDEMGRLVGPLIPQFYGADRTWGDQAEAWLYENDKFVDIRGWPYTMAHFDRNLVIETLIDGDFGTLLTEADGTPKIQTWRAHRIGSDKYEQRIAGGRYDGAVMIDGVILDDYGAALGYGILLGDNPSGEHQQVSANDFLLNYLPSVSDQFRGRSLIGVSAFNWQDVKESRAFELIAQKIGATMAMQVMNETGEADRAKGLLKAPVTAPDASGNMQTLPTELVAPGRLMYFKAGTNQRVEQVKNDRPSANVMAFQDEVIRSGLESIGWSFDFAHNSTKIGGAPMRVVVDRLNRRLDEIRNLLVKPVRRRIDGWRIAKAIKNGFLPPNKEWYKWDYQGPANITADRKYDSTIDMEETARGLMTEQKAIARRGEDLNDVYLQREIETDLKWEAASRLAKKHNIALQEAYDSLWKSRQQLPVFRSEAVDKQGEPVGEPAGTHEEE